MSIAITGANGFLGRHCIQKAVELGIAVKGIVRRENAATMVERLGAEAIIVRDFNKAAFTQAFIGCTGILHFIGIVSEQYGSFQEVNVQGTRIVMESGYESGVSRFVVPSGLGVDQYGKKKWATNPYFASKREIERMCQSHPISSVIFRPSYILGPNDELIPSLVDAILTGTVPIVGTGTTPLQPLFVEDAAMAFIGAVTGSGVDNSIYDLVGPEIITFRELIPRVAQFMHTEGFIVPKYEVLPIPIHRASEVLGLSREEIDVMLCDTLGDPLPFQHDFKISLSPLNKAIQAAIRVIKEEEK
jgi:NADH dehydrogenase